MRQRETRKASAPHPSISLRNACIQLQQYGGKLSMFRISLYVLGISAFVAAWAVYQDQRKRRPMPVKKAAVMLQQAWADHRTRV